MMATNPAEGQPMTSTNQVGVSTDVSCMYGEHKLRAMSFEDALGGPLAGGGSTVACGECNFVMSPDEKVFVCIVCRSDVAYVGKHRTKVGGLYKREAVFCETCVATGRVGQSRRGDGAAAGGKRSDWSTGLCDCSNDVGHFMDALFCLPFKLARIHHWVQFKYRQDGKIKGEEDYVDTSCSGGHCSLGGCMCTWLSGLFIGITCMDICTTWLIVLGGGINRGTREYVGIDNDTCCCCDFIMCPVCAAARYQREIKLHRGEDVPGCLAGPSWSDLQPARRPARVTYQGLPPPPLQPTMGAVVPVSAAAWSTQPVQPQNPDPWTAATYTAASAPTADPKGLSSPQPQQQKFCATCGQEFRSEADNFCPACGARRGVM